MASEADPVAPQVAIGDDDAANSGGIDNMPESEAGAIADRVAQDGAPDAEDEGQDRPESDLDPSSIDSDNVPRKYSRAVHAAIQSRARSLDSAAAPTEPNTLLSPPEQVSNGHPSARGGPAIVSVGGDAQQLRREFSTRIKQIVLYAEQQASQAIEEANSKAEHRLADAAARASGLVGSAQAKSSRLLEDTQAQARELTATAQQQATDLVSSARHEAERLRTESSASASALTAQAEQSARELRELAEREVASMRATAQREMVQQRAAFDDELATARANERRRASEFEMDLVQRQERAEQELTTRVRQGQARAAAIVRGAQERAEELAGRAVRSLAEAEQVRQQAVAEAEGIMSRTRREADELVQQVGSHTAGLLAEAHAEIERKRLAARSEIDALTRQRDHIASQLNELRTSVGLAAVHPGSAQDLPAEPAEPNGQADTVSSGDDPPESTSRPQDS